MIVGTAAAPPLAVFNGQSGNLKMMRSIGGLNATKVAMIAARQTSLLMGLTLGENCSVFVKRVAGDSRIVNLSCVFFSGAAGSLLGHPADTFVTLWQNGRNLEKLSDIWRGGLYRCMAIGSYAVIYRILYDGMINTKKSSA